MTLTENITLASLIVTALATAILAFYTWALARETLRARQETEKSRAEAKKPNIIITIEPDLKRLNVMFLVIENIGNGPAYLLKTSLTNEYESGNDNKRKLSELGILHLPVLKPKQKAMSMIGMYADIKDYDSNAITACKDIDGNEIIFENRLNGSIYKGQTGLGSDDSPRKIAQALETISRAFRSTNAGSRLQADLYDKEDRTVEKEDHEKWMEEATAELKNEKTGS
jgi:hypothetical protein